MDILHVKCEHMRATKAFIVSEKNIILFTGKQVIILDKQLNLINKLVGFNCAYDGYLSPDETKLLVVASDNKFYIVSLVSYEVIKVIVKGGYDENLSGNGCWSFDGKSVYIPALNPKSVLSDLRRYSITEPNKYESVMREKYWITKILAIPELERYLITGYDRNLLKDYFIWYDGNAFTHYEIEEFDDYILNVEVDVKNSVIRLFSFDNCEIYNFNGKKVSSLDFTPEIIKCDFFDVFKDIPELSDESKKKLRSMISFLGINDISAKEKINSTCLTPDLKQLFLCTSSGIVIMDLQTCKEINRIKIEYGANKVCFIENNMFLVEGYDSVKVFKIGV